jgi:hypothetical protein
MRSRNAVRCSVMFTVLASTAHAQGSFVNYEDPQVKPIAVVRLHSDTEGRSAEYVLACNTPDNAVEIYRAESPFSYIGRVPVGLSPVTVRTRRSGVETEAYFYTCNYLGDSVTTVKLTWVAATPPALPSVAATIENTTFVGDEPTDITFFSSSPATCAVTLHSRSAITIRNLSDMSVVTASAPLTVTPSGSTVTDAVKAPRVLASLSDGRFYCLNTMSTDFFYDFDLYAFHPSTSTAYKVGGLGTSNLNFAINSTGSQMFVVNQKSRHTALPLGEAAVAAQVTGFVQSWLHVVDLTTNGPTVQAEAPANTLPCPTFRSINLNRDYSQTSLTAISDTTQALVQPTDIVLFEDEEDVVQRVVITAFGSDKVAILEPDSSVYGGWVIQQVAIPLVNTTSSYSATGPRGLARSTTATDPSDPSPAGLVYCLNRLDNSLAVINPWNATVIHQTLLQTDGTPAVIRAGRKFLYSAQFSGNNMVACASCHLDGRTDNNVWALGELATGPAIPFHLHDGNNQTLVSMPNFPPDKALMTTQTLQGLVNYHVPELGMQSKAFSNAPYHWRGDRTDFEAFNVAFVGLQGMTNLGTTPPSGLSTSDMTAYRAFIDTIHHPPNPEQPITRTYGGELDDPDDPLVGSGAKLGLKLYHIAPLAVTQNRSCAQCHTLGEGSSNTCTLTEPFDDLLAGAPVGDDHPLETAAIRNLFQRERALVSGFGTTNNTTWTRIADTGLTHGGGSGIFVGTNAERSINDFVRRNFEAQLPGTSGQQATGATALTEFVRHFDTGTAPMVGLAFTLLNGNPTANNSACSLMEAQVLEANVGLAVYARVGGTPKGYWFDITANPPQYREEGTSTLVSRSTMVGWANTTGDVVILQATPVGSERRVASLTRVATTLTGGSPAQIELLPMVPNTAFVDVPLLSANWDPAGTIPFNWPGPGATPISLVSARYLQTELVAGGLVPALRHEPTRRFRVSGIRIRPGAKLRLGMATTTAGSTPVETVTLDLSPTGHLDENERMIWETAEELDPLQTMAWLCGGYYAPGVMDVLQGTVPPSSSINLAWNSYQVTIINEDGTSNTPVWKQLQIADAR